MNDTKFSNFSKKIENGKFIIKVKNNYINYTNAKDLNKCIFKENIINVNQIIINLKKVKIIDSSGIGVLISVHKYMLEKSGILILDEVNKEVMEVIRLLRLQNIFKIT